MKEFVVTTSITGRATALVSATDEEDARERFYNEMHSDDLVEWEFDEILNVEVNE